MGDHRAGSPVSQGDYQTSFEGAPDRELGLPGIQPDVDFNAPTVDAPHGEPAPAGWKSRPPTDKDADHGYPDKGGWLYRDPDNDAHYWYKNGVKHFMGVQNDTEGSWWSYPTEQMFDRAAGSAMNPSKVLALRGDPSKYGIAHLRDSDEARENLAEMFLQHNKDIPPEALVEFAMRENVPGERNEHYMDTARRMGIPRGKHPMFDGPTRWSDKPLPFGPPRTGRKLEDVPDAELYRAEPMDIAFQLLKAQQTLHSYDPDSVEELLHPNKRTVFISSKPNWVNEENPMSEEKQSELHDNLLAELGALENKKGMKIISARGKSVEWGDEHSIALSNVPDHHFDNIMGLASKYEQDSVLHSPKGTSSGELLKPSGEVDFPLGEGGFVDDAENMTEFNTGQRFAYGEPMDIAFQLLKERKSPEAWANKKRYDSEYQKTPKRVKYREQLNAERRKRGIYGKGGKDVSHTQGGKLTLESPHANRARHFKSKGTLRRVKVR